MKSCEFCTLHRARGWSVKNPEPHLALSSMGADLSLMVISVIVWQIEALTNNN